MKNLRSGTSLFAVAIAALAGTPAHATDPYAAPVAEDWSGFYSGRHLGAGFGHDDKNRAAVNGGGGGVGGSGATFVASKGGNDDDVGFVIGSGMDVRMVSAPLSWGAAPRVRGPSCRRRCASGKLPQGSPHPSSDNSRGT